MIYNTDSDSNELSNPTTVKFSVRDRPGALRRSLQVIGVSCSRMYKSTYFRLLLQDLGINIIGLNTRANRETTPGYRDNNVKCRCSEKKEKGVVNDLHRIGALNVTVGRRIYSPPPNHF